MARIRSIKPETFDDPDLNVLSPLARWLFAGLWTQADRDGRMECDPRVLKVRLLPYDDVAVDSLLDELAPKFITLYAVDGKNYLQVNHFQEHQRPHPSEKACAFPAPPVKLHDEPGNIPVKTLDLGMDHGSGSGNGSRSGEGEGKGVADARPPARRPTHNPGPFAGELPRDHRSCVAPCGRVCFPASQLGDFAKAHGGDLEAAKAFVRAWHTRVNAEWEPGGARAHELPGADKFAFWRDRWHEEFAPVRVPSRRKESGEDLVERLKREVGAV